MKFQMMLPFDVEESDALALSEHVANGQINGRPFNVSRSLTSFDLFVEIDGRRFHVKSGKLLKEAVHAVYDAIERDTVT